MLRSIPLAGLPSLLIAAQLAAQVPDTTIPATRYRDPASATILSAAFTVIPTVAGIAMIAADQESGAGAWVFFGGLTLGPAMGYFTTGQTGRGLVGFGIRSGVFVGTGLLVFAICPIYCDESEEVAAGIVAIGGLTLTAVLAVYDIVKVRRKLPAESAARVSMYPSYVPATKSPGIGIKVTF